MTQHGMTSQRCPKKKWQTIPSASKTMGTVFQNATGCILLKFLPHGKTTNAAHYLYMFQKLQHALCDKCPGKENITLQLDNGGSYTADMCMNIVKKNRCELLPTSSYSPDLAPLYYCLFGIVQEQMQSQKYATNDSPGSHMTLFANC